jgi:hypothetical protein
MKIVQRGDLVVPTELLPHRFIVRRGHVEDTIEEVVKGRRRYLIVEKVDRVAARIVRRLNPRRAR